MRYECVSADAAAVRIREADSGRAWCFGVYEEDGQRDLAIGDAEEDVATPPASFIAAAGAYVFALREARSRGLIDR